MVLEDYLRLRCHQCFRRCAAVLLRWGKEPETGRQITSPTNLLSGRVCNKRLFWWRDRYQDPAGAFRALESRNAVDKMAGLVAQVELLETKSGTENGVAWPERFTAYPGMFKGKSATAMGRDLEESAVDLFCCLLHLIRRLLNQV